MPIRADREWAVAGGLAGRPGRMPYNLAPDYCAQAHPVSRHHALTESAAEPRDFELGAACCWVATQCRREAEAGLREGLEVVQILESLNMDAQGLLVGALRPLAPFTEHEQAQIKARFGAQTLALLQGATRMRQLSALSGGRGRAVDAGGPEPADNADGQARPGKSSGVRLNEENLRKMLLAMVDDGRVVLIELACHLAVLRRAKLAERVTQRRLARLTLEVYAPLANRLGAGQIKWRMEDYALQFLQPQAYAQLAARLDQKRAAREHYIEQFIDAAQGVLRAAGVVGEVHGRPKHLYSIWKKMRAKDSPFESLLDLRATRIVVRNIADCYGALAAVHARWPRLGVEFEDYIATPKANGYRSVHTVVIGPQQQLVEVQIRTHEMHEQSELGRAAHWRYKENLRADDSIDHKVLRLRQLLRWKDEMQGDAPPAGEHEHEHTHAQPTQTHAARSQAEERVYAFTSQGKVISLPAGATPLDFAYAIHTEVGHCARGARVNGKMAPLAHGLQTGDQVHIHTVPGGRPSRDWLRPERGYIRTRRARSRIAQYFKRADYAQHVADGRSALERELSRLGLDDVGYDKIARAADFDKTDSLLAALGAGDVKLARALAPFRRPPTGRPGGPPAGSSGGPDGASGPGMARKTAPPRPHRPDSFSVSGVGNVLTRLANCCSPIPGDSIVGFITAGRGVSVHRQNCRNMRTPAARQDRRLVEVAWGGTAAATWPVALHISVSPATDSDKLLAAITQIFQDENIVLLNLHLQTSPATPAGTHIHLKAQIPGTPTLRHLTHRLTQLPEVHKVARVGG